MSGAVLTRAAAALRKKLAPRGMKEALTRELDCASGLVTYWCSGKRMPNAIQVAYLEVHYGIKARWWGEPMLASQKKAA